jgi:hypothetical protein
MPLAPHTARGGGSRLVQSDPDPNSGPDRRMLLGSGAPAFAGALTQRGRERGDVALVRSTAPAEDPDPEPERVKRRGIAERPKPR